MLVILIRSISFESVDGPVCIKPGSEVYLDLISKVAYWSGYHFYIKESEYSHLN